MAVTYTAQGGSFAVSKPGVPPETHPRNAVNSSTCDLSPDGRRPGGILTFLLNFIGELRRMAP